MRHIPFLSLLFPSHDWQQGAGDGHEVKTAHTWQRAAGRGRLSAGGWSVPGHHCSSSSHSQTLLPESQEWEPDEMWHYIYVTSTFFLSIKKEWWRFYTINWSVISTALSWVCSSFRAFWARLLLPTAEVCWKFVWMASIRNMSISSMTAAVDDPTCCDKEQKLNIYLYMLNNDLKKCAVIMFFMTDNTWGIYYTKKYFLTTWVSNSSWQPSMLLQTVLFLGLSSSPGLPSQMVTLPFSEGEAFWWRIALSGIRNSLWNAEDSFRVEPIPLLGLRFTRACGQQHGNVKCKRLFLACLSWQ